VLCRRFEPCVVALVSALADANPSADEIFKKTKHSKPSNSLIHLCELF